ncbi:MAG TPA: hypothetical protein VMG08_09770 [Allosphingosinicella sp.]|nr:hypothetical protein [Allosphingosinicella sp.]
MALSLILALQSVAAPAPASPPFPSGQPAFAAIDFDLARHRPATGGGCETGGAGEVLVCGRRGGRGEYPLDYWARIFPPPGPIRAEMNLGGNVQGRIHAEAMPLDRGAVSNRFMLGIRWPF